MKSKVLFIFFLNVLVVGQVFCEKKSLIIGIGNYPENSGWSKISSKNDVVHITTAIKSLGFEDKNISIILDEQGTKNGILKGFESLLESVQNGDFIFIHFSGHGQQVLDDNNDEIDGLDEAIVPFDSPSKYIKGKYEGDNLIRDDYLNKICQQIRIKAGPTGRLVLVLDSCHSGTGNRSFGRARGTENVMAPDSFQIQNLKEDIKIIETVANENQLSPFACYHGSSPNEFNYETRDDQGNAIGSLSFALSSTLSKMNGNYTFQELFERVKARMRISSPKQRPQWEGYNNPFLIDFAVKNNKEIYSLKTVEEDFISIGIGTINGVYKGTRVDVLDLQKDEVVASGIVTKESLSTSEIEIDNGPSLDIRGAYAIQVVQLAVPNIQCTFGFDEFIPDSIITFLKVVGAGFIQFNNVNPDLHLNSCDNKYYEIQTKEGYVIHKSLIEEFKEKKGKLAVLLKKYVQSKFLKSYEIESTKLKSSMDLLIGTKEIALKNVVDVEVASKVKFKINNIGDHPFYYALLDIGPDNKTSIIFPSKNSTSADHFLKSNGSYVSQNVTVSEPKGLETLKLIISKEPIDFKAILNFDGYTSEPDKSEYAFQDLFSLSTIYNESRGEVNLEPNLEEVGVKSFYFIIK